MVERELFLLFSQQSIGKMTPDGMLSNVEGYDENDSDDDSFNSAVAYLDIDLYNDVLFRHAIVPKDTIQAEERGELLQRSESFFSTHSVGQASNCTFSVFRSKKQDILMSEVGNESFSTALNVDGESCNSSNLISSGVSNDDDLSFISDNTFEEGLGLSVISSVVREEQIDNILYPKEEQIVTSSAPILHWGVPVNSKDIDTNFDERSILSNPDNDIILSLSDVTSETTPTLGHTTATSTTILTHESSIGFFGQSSF